jgi:hypothetical protein
MSSNFNRVNIDDKEKDEATMKNRLMDKLCKRQREVEGRGVSTEYEVIDVWQSSFTAFESKEDINNFLERYQKESNYFELLPNDMIRLTERGRKYCRDLER